MRPKNTKRQQWLDDFMKEHNCPLSTATYHYGKYVKGIKSKRTTFYGLDRETLYLNRIHTQKSDEYPWGWKVNIITKAGRDYELMPVRLKSGHIAYAFYGYRTLKTKERKTILLTLQQILYAMYIGDIESGMVIDHIDNNPYNNDLNNLQMITRAENTAKNAVGHNQYTVNKNN